MFNSYIFAIQCRKSLIFQSMNSVRSNSLSLKYQKFTPTDWKDMGIRNFVSVLSKLLNFQSLLIKRGDVIVSYCAKKTVFMKINILKQNKKYI